MFEAVDVLLFILVLSLAGALYATLPFRTCLLVYGEVLGVRPSQGEVTIVTQVAGGRRMITEPRSNGRFRIDLPVGCAAELRFLQGDRVAWSVTIEYRSDPTQRSTLLRRTIDLGLIDLEPSLGDQRELCSRVLCDPSVTITETGDPARHAPNDRQMLDRVGQLFDQRSGRDQIRSPSWRYD
ncbi:MAG: hypothetical protein ABI432_09305 [Flavobacteriales bacterium]